MKSEQKSWGKIFRKQISLAFSTGLVLSAMACGVSDKRIDIADDASLADEPKISYQASLADDKKTIEELRKNIPTEKKTENDQLKEILFLMGEVKENPSRIRERFSRTTSRMRQAFSRTSKKERDDFNRREKKEKDEFYRKLKADRDKFNKQKTSREERKYFYDEQDRIRREFAASSREARDQFNADSKVKNDDFNFLMKDREQEFKLELKAYTARYSDYQKQLKLQQEEERKKRKENTAHRTSRPETSTISEEVKDAVKPTRLKTGDDGL